MPKERADQNRSVDQLNASVTKFGPEAYLRSLNQQDPAWQNFLNATQSGDEQALAIVARLRPVADAGTAESLDMSVARALPVAPGAVLGLTHAGFKIEALCTSPFIEPTAEVEKRYNDAALRALDALPIASRKQPDFDECHRVLSLIAHDIADQR